MIIDEILEFLISICYFLLISQKKSIFALCYEKNSDLRTKKC